MDKEQELQQQIDELKKDLQNNKQDIDSLKRNPIDRLIDQQSKDRMRDITSSQIADIFWNDITWYSTNFESLDGFYTTVSGGTVTIGASALGTGYGIDIDVSSSASSTALVTKERPVYVDDSLFNRETRFRTNVYFSQITNQTFEIGVGIGRAGSSDSYGFTISNAAISGFSRTSGMTNESTINLNTNINTTDSFTFEIVFFPNSRIDFYINNNIAGSITTDIPQTQGSTIWSSYLANTAAEAKTVSVYYVDILQSKNTS